MAELAAFLGVAVLVIVTPGPDTALTVRSTLLGGRAAGVWTAAGVSGGQVVWAVFTAVGLASLLVASETAFLVVRYAGAAYLIWLGLQALLGGREPEPGEQGEHLSRREAARQGLLSNLSNPKMAAFFPSLLPQFADTFAALLALGVLFAAMTFAWLSLYAAIAGFLRPVRRALEAISGAVLIALGLRLATERR
jgi:threonine/homoserine/homoserine lactone efflux protein